MSADLLQVLGEAQRIGLIGPGALDVAVAQARRVAQYVPRAATTLVDLGSGGGLPGLVLAEELDHCQVVLVDRRGRAIDALRRGVAALGVAERVTVVARDAYELATDPAWRASVDVVTARGFGPPAEVAELGLPLVRPGGLMIVTAVGSGEATWPDAGVATLGARVQTREPGLVVLQAGRCPEELPRRRRRPPLF